MKKVILIFVILFISNISFAQRVLWEELFDSDDAFSNGWTLINNDTSASIPEFYHPFKFVNLGEQNTQSGNYFFKFSFLDANDKNHADDWIITPELFAIHTGDSISFWCGAVDGNYKDSLKIWISTTDNKLSSFRLVDYFKVDGPVGAWHKKSYDLSGYAGQNIFFAVNYYMRDGGALGSSSDNVWIDHFLLTGKGYGGIAPSSFELQQNFPNPFNPVTEISFSVLNNSNVTIKIYNTSGKEILTLINGYYQKGKYNVSLDAGNFASGVYFYKMIAGDFSATKKMSLIK